MEQEKHEKRKWRVDRRVCLRFFLLLLAVFAVLLLYYYVKSLSLRTVHYTLQTEVRSPIRIVHLSDLHNAHYGKRNKELVEQVAAQEPDLIIMSGDMLNRDEDNTAVVTALISDLSPVAPIYYGYGNHEKAWEQRFGRDLRPILESAGAVVVDNDYVDLEIKGTPVRIGGYAGYYPVPHMTTSDITQQELVHAFSLDFQNTDRLKLLINHIPTSWVDWGYVNKYPVDLVFSGHYHGGVMRIPILDQGLYAPYVGWFPPFTKGVCTGSRASCVLSAGLGNEYHIPRVNNPPEIVVVDLVPGKQG